MKTLLLKWVKCAVCATMVWGGILQANADSIQSVWNFDDDANRYARTGSDLTGTNWITLTDGNPVVTSGEAADYISFESDHFLQSTYVRLNQSNVGGLIHLGSLPGIAKNAASVTETDFPECDLTVSFWARTDSTLGSRTMIGNRNPDISGKYNFVKIDGSGFQYYAAAGGGTSGSGSYILGDSSWHYYTLSKTGDSLALYRDGKSVQTISANGNLYPVSFSLGGDYSGKNEHWTGDFDNVSITGNALTAAEVKSQYDTILAGLNAGLVVRPNPQVQSTPLIATDQAACSITKPTASGQKTEWTSGATKWNVLNKGLESTNVTAIDASIDDAGQLVIEGNENNAGGAWNGVTLQTAESYTASPDNIVTFSVDRVSLAKTGDDARASMWMYTDESGGKYVHFSQNTESDNQFSYNCTDKSNIKTGGGSVFNGTAVALDEVVNMKLRHDGSVVWMYVNDELVGTQKVSFDTFQLMLTGQTRGNDVQSAYVKAVFANPTVSVFDRSISGAPQLATNSAFASDSELKDWVCSSTTGVELVTARQVLNVLGNNTAVYRQAYCFKGALTVRADLVTSALSGDSATGLMLQGGNSDCLRVYQTAKGEWMLDWNGIEVSNLKEITLESEPLQMKTLAVEPNSIQMLEDENSASLFVGDFNPTQILLTTDAVLSPTSQRLSLYLNSEHFQFDVENMDEIFHAGMFTRGSGASGSFDNFAITGHATPEPAAWLLLLLGGLLLPEIRSKIF